MADDEDDEAADNALGVLIIFVVYITLVVVASFGAYRMQKARESTIARESLGDREEDIEKQMGQHFLGGRTFGPLVTAMTLAGTTYSGYSVIGVPADFATNGYLAIRWFSLNISCQTGFMLVAPRLRRLGLERRYISPLDFVSDRFRSPVLHLIVTLATVVPATFYLTAQVIALRDTLGIFSGLVSPEAITIACCVIMLIYEWFGGMTSVAWTDVIQGFIMTVGITVAAFCINAQYGNLAEAKPSLKPEYPSFYSVPSSEGMLLMFAFQMGACAFIFNPFVITRIYAAQHYSSVKLGFIVICLMHFVIQLPG